MYDAADSAEAAAAHAGMHELLDVVIGLSGSISGEHGVGLSKLPYLDKQLPSLERALMHRVKRVFDPNDIMNPGKAY
jgi:D-lactate dehydrogenase (cytochrome)/glycolate oxidase